MNVSDLESFFGSKFAMAIAGAVVLVIALSLLTNPKPASAGSKAS